MKSFPNIERAWHSYRGYAAGKSGEYLGYSDKATTPFRITKNRIKGSYKWQGVGKILNADNREAVKIIYAKDLAEMSRRLQDNGGLRKNRCWKGYKPVKGKRAYSKGSCRRIRRNAKGDARRQRESDAFYQKYMGPGGALHGLATREELSEYENAGYPERNAIQNRVWNRVQMERINMAKKAGRISNRTARAMVRAGLPLSRSELRGNQSRFQRGLNKKMSPEMRERVSNQWHGYHLAKIVEAIKNLKKKNYNDEMIESVVVKERPGRPKDFIIIVKHRYYVNGARVYSAGLKTEETIEKFVRVMGTKTKRIGNSDYVFNIYGVRFPEVIATGAGKLFPNNSSPDEIPLEAKIYGTLNGKKLDTQYRAVLVTKSRYGNLIKIQEMIKGSWNDVMSGWGMSTLLERPSNRLYLDAGQGWAVEGMMRALGEAMIRVNYDGSKR